MIPLFLGIKKRQSQEFTPEGIRIPVTVVSAGPCYVTRILDSGTTAKQVEIGFGIIKHINKAKEGHIKKAGLTHKLRFLRSFRVSEIPEGLKAGMEILVSNVFQPGDLVSVTAVSKGKGFAGVVKRHGFKGGPRTHGQSDRERAPGSIGQTTTPGRVYRGKRMAGRMGTDTVTVKHLRVITVSPDNEMTLKGLIPGGRNGLVLIRKNN